MTVDTIPLISVSYNSADLVENLLSSFRAYYLNPVTIVDGSDAEHTAAIEAVCSRYQDVSFIHFDYNIHHGPGMAWAFQNLPLSGPVLVLDTDIIILKGGFLEAMLSELEPDAYGVGYVNFVNEDGFDVDYEEGSVRYLHPACMLCNIEVLRQWPLPTKHGAPMTEPMLALHRAGKQNLIRGIDWVKEDFAGIAEARHYIRHDWQGTVKLAGSYNLDEWSEAARQAATLRSMIMSLVPAGERWIVEIGAGVGALARTCKEANPSCRYTSVEITAEGANTAKGLSDQVISCHIDCADEDFLRELSSADCWILNQCLEFVGKPEQLLRRIRAVIAADICVIVVVPNAQHWSIQAGLCRGDLHFEGNVSQQGSHVKRFSRTTMLQLFGQTGFQVVGGYSVLHRKLDNDMIANSIRQLAASVGADPDQALQDAQPVQYCFKILPI
jgi:hypothetical protein